MANFKKETQRNLLIVFGLNIIDKACAFFGLILLARLLRPEDFGIIAAAEILIVFVGMLEEHVFEASAIAISKENNFNTTLNVVFMTRTLLCFLLYVALYAMADLWGHFYNNAQLSAAVKILGLTIIVSNFSFVPSTSLIKERRFDKFVVPAALKNLLFYGSALILAIAGFNFWSLVIGRIISSIGVVISFFIISPWKPKFVWDKKIFLEMFNYIKVMYIFIFLVVFTTQIDRLAVSKILGFALAGYYTIAYSFGNWAVSNVFAVADRVAFPLYTEIKGDQDLLRTVYIKFFKYILFLSIPILSTFIVFANHFVLLFLGTKWTDVVLPLRILCFAGFFGLIGNVSNSLLKSINRLDIEIKRNLALAIALLITLIPLTILYGLNGSCTAVLISFALVQPLYFNYVMKMLKIERQQIARPFFIILFSSLSGVIFYFFCNVLFLNKIESVFGKFSLSILSYACAYLATIFPLLRVELFADIKTFFEK